jgi:DtxR family Mn-dependent transcriptional regulator
MNLSPMTIIWIFIVLLVLLVVFWPRSGLLARYRAAQKAVMRQQVEDALKSIFNLQQEGKELTAEGLAAALGLSLVETGGLVQRMRSQDLIEQGGPSLSLSETGQRWALQVIRAHRLWERYLADEARMPLSEIHQFAHQREHGMTQQQVNDLDASLGHPLYDPHGDPIPNAEGRMHEQANTLSLTEMKIGALGKIAHLEDEPPLAYSQLLAMGLSVGQVVSVLARTPEKIVVSDGENEYTLAPVIAANVTLGAVEEIQAARDETIVPLTLLKSQSEGEIVLLDEACQGFTRRRFLDLGLTPGTKISPELDNAFREPRAYRVRGTLIALRNDQANMIWVRPFLPGNN